MIQTFSSTIRRREMDAVLTCMVDEKIGPGELNTRLIQTVKEFFSCAGAVAVRSPIIALKYALKALNVEKATKIMISALAPGWQLFAIEELGYEPMILDVNPETSLVTPETCQEGIQKGGRVLILHESLGIVPDMEPYLALGIPVIEDVSQSAGAFVAEKTETQDQQPKNEETASEENKVKPQGKMAGTFGVFTICGLEEHDVMTAGGGALVICPGRRDWPVLKSVSETIPSVEILPDINAALAYVQFKEFSRNEKTRKEIYTFYSRSLMAGKNKTLVRDNEDGSTVWSFPVVLNSAYKDVKQYTQKKEIEINLAFENSVFGIREEQLSAECRNAKNLFLKTALFPLYPRLSHSQVEKITKVLGTLP